MLRKLLLNGSSVAQSICTYNTAPYNVFDEINQQRRLGRNVVKQILFSRRLLIDHVECIESTLFDVELHLSKLEIFTVANVSLVSSLSVLLNVAESVYKPIRYSAALIGGGFAMMYFYKCYKRVKNSRIQNRVESLLQSIGNFSNGVKKNITYFNELLYMKNGKVPIEDIHYKRAWGCIQALKTVTQAIFTATRRLEENYPLSTYLNDLYTPIEDLKSCHYFTRQLIEFTPQNVKDFYNIFAYVQSQFLLRLSLTVSENSSIPFFDVELPELKAQVQKVLIEEEKNFLKISSSLKRKRADERSKRHKSNAINYHSAPATILKDISLKLTSSIVAVAEECEKLDSSLQDVVNDGTNDDKDLLSNLDKRTKLLDLASSLRTVELFLSTCNDDFQRLMLIYNKYVLHKSSSRNENDGVNEMIDMDATDNYERLKSFSLTENDTEPSRTDDYFAYSNEYEQQLEELDKQREIERYVDCELYNLDRKTTKKRFKPVLKQLKDRIDPIRKSTLQTERRILEAKGFDVNKFYGQEYAGGDRVKRGGGNSDDSESSGDESRKERTPRSDQYSEVREFLVRKAPINLFNFPKPPVGLCEEEIIGE